MQNIKPYVTKDTSLCMVTKKTQACVAFTKKRKTKLPNAMRDSHLIVVRFNMREGVSALVERNCVQRLDCELTGLYKDFTAICKNIS